MLERTDDKESFLSKPPSPTDACLIVVLQGIDFHQEQLGEKFILNPQGTLIGNQRDCEIQLRGPGVPRRARLYYDTDEDLWLLENLEDGTLNYTYLNNMMCRFALLSDGDNLQLGKQGAILGFLQGESIQASLSEVLNKRINEEKKRADTDKLTQANNKDALDRLVDEQVEYCRMYDQPLSAIFLDVDHFKQVNDMYLHAGGNAVLVAISAKIQEQIRPLDTFARYGGEEFVILLRDATYQKAISFAERIRALVEGMVIDFEDRPIQVTISLGVATLEPNWSGERLINEANRCLHTAKKTGRNQVIGYQGKRQDKERRI